MRIYLQVTCHDGNVISVNYTRLLLSIGADSHGESIIAIGITIWWIAITYPRPLYTPNARKTARQAYADGLACAA